ncbi:MAG TPA: ABC transporter substrate-binding protein, partial [Chloroflexota bacterium]
TLDIDDGQENTHPYLAEALPQLNSDSWRVLADGKMETIWHLRPNLTWHDGTPFSANDFVFALQVYKTPELGLSTGAPFPQIEDITSPDARTVVFRWAKPFPQAAALGNDFQALPSHVLKPGFDQGDMAAFMNHPFWGPQYVGLGPYKLDRWDPGASIDAAAFDGHTLGRPKIDRIVIRFVPDENTALTTLLAGDVQFSTDRTIRFEQAQLLQERWGATGGTTILTPAQPRHMAIQQRAEHANPKLLLDVRGRQAVAHAIDRQSLNEALFMGQGAMSETLITSFFPAYADVDRAIGKVPFDGGEVTRLLGSLGYTKGSDGFFAVGGEHLTLGFLQEAGDQTERERTIITDAWRRLGIDSQTTVISSTQLRDNQVRSSFPSVYSTAASSGVKGGTKNLQNFTTGHTSNYGGWSRDDYDRLYATFSSTLDTNERNRQVVQMAKELTDEVAFIMLFFNYNVSAYSSAVTGPDPHAFDTLVDWNIQEWQLS